MITRKWRARILPTYPYRRVYTNQSHLRLRLKIPENVLDFWGKFASVAFATVRYILVCCTPLHGVAWLSGKYSGSTAGGYLVRTLGRYYRRQ